MLDKFGALFLLLGPPVIIFVGVGITIVTALLWNGLKRWVVLFCGPVLTLIITSIAIYFVTTFIHPSEGTGFLLGGLVMGLYFIALFLYYPILLIVATFHFFKSRKNRYRINTRTTTKV